MLRGQVRPASPALPTACRCRARILSLHASQYRIDACSGAHVLRRRLDGVFEAKSRLRRVAFLFLISFYV